MASRVKLNSAGIRELLNSPEVVSELEARGARVLSAAQAAAPVESGAYRDGLQMETQTGRTRARVKIVSTDYKGHIIEARDGILSRALDAAG